jgi:hypothetical protein
VVFRNLLAEGGAEAALSCSRCRRHDPTRRLNRSVTVAVKLLMCRRVEKDRRDRGAVEKDLLASNKTLLDCSGRDGSCGCERAEAIGSS